LDTKGLDENSALFYLYLQMTRVFFLLFLSTFYFTAHAQLLGEGKYVEKQFDFSPEALEARYRFFQNYPGVVETEISKWREIGPLENPGNYGQSERQYKRIRGIGRIYCIEFDPNVESRIFAGSPTGGLWISRNNGESWVNGGTDFLPNPGISHIQLHPTDSNTWFIATGDGDDLFSFSYGIYRTQNGGKSWVSINGQKNPLPVTSLTESWNPVTIRKMALVPNNPNILYAATTEGLYRTTNALAGSGSVEWEKLYEGSFYDVQIVPNSRGARILAGGETVVYSLNSGESWQEIRDIEETHYGKLSGKRKRTTIRISPDKSTQAYLALTVDDGEGSTRFEAVLYRYDLSRQRMEFIAELPREMGPQKYMGAGRAQSITVSPENASEIILGNVMNLYRSMDGGKTFEALGKDFHDDLHWVCYRESSAEIWLGTDGGVSSSVDSGQTWRQHDVNLNVLNAFNMGYGRRVKTYSYGGYDIGCNLTDSLGQFMVATFGDGFETEIDDSNSDSIIYYTAVNGYISRIVKGQKSTFVTPPRNLTGAQWKRHFVIDRQRSGVIYSAGNSPLVSQNYGDDWEVLGPEIEHDIWEVFLGHQVKEAVYAIAVNPFAILKYEYNSNQWIDVTPSVYGFENNQPIKRWASDVYVHPTDPNRFWVTYGRYENGGGNYPIPKVIEVNNGIARDLTGILEGDRALENLKVYEVVYQGGSSDRVFVGTNAGVYYKDGRTKKWIKIPGLPHAAVHELEMDECRGVLYAATYGRGIWETDLLLADDPVRIRKDETWEEDRDVYSNIIIPSGKTLTIKGVVNMAEGKEIIVLPGAKLIIDGGEVTNRCGMKWAGFDLRESNSFLFRRPKGKVEFLNNGRFTSVKRPD
jgi:hypothetical protein